MQTSSTAILIWVPTNAFRWKTNDGSMAHTKYKKLNREKERRGMRHSQIYTPPTKPFLFIQCNIIMSYTFCTVYAHTNTHSHIVYTFSVKRRKHWPTAIYFGLSNTYMECVLKKKNSYGRRHDNINGNEQKIKIK